MQNFVQLPAKDKIHYNMKLTGHLDRTHIKPFRLVSRTTKSVLLRDSAVRKSLESKKQQDKEISREMKEKRKREKKLRSQVSVKAMANDHSWQLKKAQDEKLKSFRLVELTISYEPRQELFS